MWNLLLNVKDLRDNPSVKPAACQLPFQGSPKENICNLPAQHKARPSGALQGSPKENKRVPFQGSIPRSIIHPQIFASRNPAEGNGQLLPPFPLGDGLTAARS